MKNFDIHVPVYAFDIQFEHLADMADVRKTMRPLPKYPPVVRDLVILVPESVSFRSVQDLVTKYTPKNILESLELFDVYQGKQIENGMVSLGFRIVYRSPSRSLTDREINKLHDKMTTKVLKETGGTLRP